MAPRKRTPKKYGPEELKNISSMGTRLDDLQSRNRRDMNDLNRKIGGTANRLRFDTARNAVEIKRTGEVGQVKEVTKSVNKILDKLGLTIAALSKGIIQMTAATASATKEAIQDYGRAISEDIRINKQNFVAMTLSQASPVFGYFVGKLFETQMFRTALEKIKGKSAQLYAGLLDRFKRSKEKYEEEVFFEEGQPVIGGAGGGGVARRAKRAKTRITAKAKAIAGGIVGGGGGSCTVDFSQITEVIKETTKIQIAQSRKQFNYFTKLIKGAGGGENLLFKIHSEIYKMRSALVEEEEQGASLLDAFLEQHETLAKIYRFYKLMEKATTGPIKWLFSIRGGYRADLPKSGNVFRNIFDVLSLIYTKGMHKLDVMISYLLQMGESLRKITGAGPMETPEEKGIYTMWGKIKEWFKPGGEKEKKTLAQKIRGRFEEWAQREGLDMGGIEEAWGYVPLKLREGALRAVEKVEGYQERLEGYLKGIFGIASEEAREAKDKVVEEAKKQKTSFKERYADKIQKVKENKDAVKQKFLDKLEERKQAILKQKGVMKQIWEVAKTVVILFGSILSTIFGPIFAAIGQALGITGIVAGAKGAAKGAAGKVGKVGGWLKGGAATKFGMGRGLSIGGGAIAGIMSGMEVGKERGTAEGIAQGAISGSLSTIGGLILGPLGTVLGKMLGDALGKYAFKLGDWLAEHFNIFSMIQDYIIDPVKNFFSSMGSLIKRLLGIKEEEPKTGAEMYREHKRRQGEAAKTGGIPGSEVRRSTNWDETWAGANTKNERGWTNVENASPEQLKELRKRMSDQGAEGVPGINVRSGVNLEGLKPGVYNKFLSMGEEYQKKSGEGIVVNSAYRTRAEQAQLYATNRNAAAPGHSKHELGTAIDIQSFNAGQLDSMGLLDKYGFSRPVPGEPWHLQSEVGDATFRRRPISKKDLISMMAAKESLFTRAFLDSNTDLGKTFGAGLDGVSKNVASNTSTISNILVSNNQNVGAGRNSRSSEIDSDLTAIISGNLT